MNLIRAETKAKYLVKELQQFCDRIEVVGDIRRRKQSIDKIDILLVPKGFALFELMVKLVNLGSEDGTKISNKKTLVMKDDIGSVAVNIWITSIEYFSIMFFIKTGGSRSVKRIETLCKDRKWQFSISSGTIVNEDGVKLPIKEEADIFKLLEIPYIEPSQRE